jgi:phosphotransferase system HPr-like phosphotransfer protein
MDLANMTFDEVSLMYGNYIDENIAIVSNEQLTTLMNQSSAILAESAKQYAKNLENEKKANQDILNASLKLDEVIKVNSEKHSKNEVVTLNVGGRLFATFKGTLLKYQHSYFYALLNSGNFLPGPDGSYFIDRSPTHFPLIMDYLRTGRLSTKGLKSWEIQDLEKELDYYLLQIAAPLKSTEWHWDLSPSRKPAKASFSEDDLKMTKTSGGGFWNCPVIGSSPVSEFTVKIISGLFIFIGFCSIDEFVQKGKHFDRVKNGCFFFCYDGDVFFNEGNCKSYGSQLKINDNITAIKTGTSIRFFINGVDQGEAINNAEGDMYPLVELFEVGNSVMIVPNT